MKEVIFKFDSFEDAQKFLIWFDEEGKFLCDEVYTDECSVHFDTNSVDIR